MVLPGEINTNLVPRRSPPAHSTRLGERCRDVTIFRAKSCEREENAWVLGWKITMTWKEKVNDDAMKDGFAQTF